MTFHFKHSESPDTLVIEIERGGWRLHEEGESERLVSKPEQLLEALQTISERKPWVPSDQENRWGGGLLDGRGVRPPGYNWDGLVSTLRASVHSPPDAPVGEVLAVFAMLGTGRVRAASQSWWIRDPDGTLRPVIKGLHHWLDEVQGGRNQWPEAMVRAVDEDEDRDDGGSSGHHWSYGIGPWRKRDRAVFEERVRLIYQSREMEQTRSYSLELPAEASVGEMASLVRMTEELGLTELGLQVQLPLPVIDLVDPQGGRNSWWWPRIWNRPPVYPRRAWEFEREHPRREY